MSNSSIGCWQNNPIQVFLPEKIGQHLTAVLKKAGQQEIGGILMGEHVADRVFRVRDLTVQHQGGALPPSHV
jgi:[CysO sulfur-carrier protein]-S-L-cysteine hydrolase